MNADVKWEGNWEETLGSCNRMSENGIESSVILAVCFAGDTIADLTEIVRKKVTGIYASEIGRSICGSERRKSAASVNRAMCKRNGYEWCEVGVGCGGNDGKAQVYVSISMDASGNGEM